MSKTVCKSFPVLAMVSVTLSSSLLQLCLPAHVTCLVRFHHGIVSQVLHLGNTVLCGFYSGGFQFPVFGTTLPGGKASVKRRKTFRIGGEERRRSCMALFAIP